MKLILRIKPHKLQPTALQPIVGPMGITSKDVVKDIETYLKSDSSMKYTKHFFQLDVDPVLRKYTLTPMEQPDSLILIYYSKNNMLTKPKLTEYANQTINKSYAHTVETRLKELESVMNSCKLKYNK